MTEQFVKHHGYTIDSDIERLQDLDAICRQVDSALTPKILTINKNDESTNYEHINFKKSLVTHVKNKTLWFNLGKALRELHSSNAKLFPRVLSKKLLTNSDELFTFIIDTPFK